MSSAPALELRSLTKAFGSRSAVAAVDLRIEAGSAWGLVGPNGAGKTTLLSMAVGLLRPDAGNAIVCGHAVWGRTTSDKAKAELGVLPDGLALPSRLTGRELLSYLGLLRGLPAELVAARIEELLSVLDLAGAGSTLIVDYSTGMRKKIGLAAAVLHAPTVLVLDEPLEAVDPVSALTIEAILDGFRKQGGTLLLSTHTLSDVERLCDHVAVMDQGRLLRAGSVREVSADRSLAEVLVDLVGVDAPRKGLSWFAS